MGNQKSTEITPIAVHQTAISTPTSTFMSTPTVSIANDEKQVVSPSSTYTFTARLSSKKSIPPLSEISPVSDQTVDHSTLPSLSMFKPQLKKNNSSYSNITNGITGTHIHSRISKIAAKFWHRNMENVGMEQQLEIGCSIFFGAMSANKEMKQIMIGNLKQNNKNIKEKSLKYLDMIGWLFRNLLVDDIDLYLLLTNLGVLHQNMGVRMHHFHPLLDSLHQTLSYYFPKKYTIEVKYAFDEIFSVAAQIMSGQDISYCAQLHDIAKSFQNENDIQFLSNLSSCLQSRTGKEYFYQYLKQTFCDEIVLFLEMVCKFKNQPTEVQRFMVGRQIMATSVDPDATFTLNLSYQVRQNALNAMQELEQQFKAKQPLDIDAQFFSEIEHEIYRLILINHWKTFVNNIKILQSKSYGL